eukprot:6201255-Pleurochrysis_carterae.AAC.6
MNIVKSGNDEQCYASSDQDLIHLYHHQPLHMLWTPQNGCPATREHVYRRASACLRSSASADSAMP